MGPTITVWREPATVEAEMGAAAMQRSPTSRENINNIQHLPALSQTRHSGNSFFTKDSLTPFVVL